MRRSASTYIALLPENSSDLINTTLLLVSQRNHPAILNFDKAGVEPGVAVNDEHTVALHTVTFNKTLITVPFTPYGQVLLDVNYDTIADMLGTCLSLLG